jgi:hypothetical protein
MDPNENIFNRRTLLIISALLGALAISLAIDNFWMPRKKPVLEMPKPMLVCYQSPLEHPKVRYFSEYPAVTYIDEEPFGSLDSVKEKNKYGTQTMRKPRPGDYPVFTRLEKEAKVKGLIKD